MCIYIYISCPRLVDLSPYALLSIHITLRFRKVGLAACVLHVASWVPIKDCRCPVGYVIGMVDVVWSRRATLSINLNGIPMYIE